MNWVCHKCSNETDVGQIICSSCSSQRLPDAELVETDKDRLIAKYSTIPGPDWLTRMFSFKHRITRLDFALAFFISALFYLASIDLAYRIGALSNHMIITLPVTCILCVYGSKRCRDLDYNPWWGIPCVWFFLGNIVLLFLPGTKGANQYGPDPRIPNPVK